MWSVSLDRGTADGKVHGTRVPSGKRFCTTTVQYLLSNDGVILDFTSPLSGICICDCFLDVSSHVCHLSIHVYVVYVYGGG